MIRQVQDQDGKKGACEGGIPIHERERHVQLFQGGACPLGQPCESTTIEVELFELKLRQRMHHP